MSPDTVNLVRLVVNGAAYEGWKSVRISAGIERQARDFELDVTDRWPGQTSIPRRIQPGDPCELYIGPDLVLTGYVDATPIKYDGKSVSVSVRGRSKTADLVDCCPIPTGEQLRAPEPQWREAKPPQRQAGAGRGFPQVDALKFVPPPAKSAAQWSQQKLEVIAAALTAPYGVRVVAEANTGKPIAEHQVQVGESVFESIDRMMRLRQVLSTDNERGDLVFISVGSSGRATTAIETGVNVLAASTELDYKGVFSEYIVKGQRAGNDDAYAQDVAEEEGDASDADDPPTNSIGQVAVVKDARAKRRRVLVIKQSGQADDGTCKERAEYERAHRAAKALQTAYTLAGWRQADGRLWRPNLLVRVRDNMIGFDTEMLVAETTWILDESGLRTEVRVGPQDGYVSKAGKLKKSQKGGGKEWSEVK